MRPAQHLNPLNIKQSNVVDVLPSDVHVVNIGADWWVKCRDRFVVSLRTQVVHVGGSQASIVATKQVGHHVYEIQRIVYLQPLYHFFAVGADGKLDILNGRLLPLRGYKHLLKLSRCHIG